MRLNENARGRKPTGCLRRLIGLVVLLVLLYFGGGPVLRLVGEWLVHEDSPKKADIIVILAGSPVVRALEGADRYRQGLAPWVYVSRGNLEGADLVKDVDLNQTGDWDLTRRVLEARGVPRDAIYLDERYVVSTLAEARRIGAFMKNRKLRSMVLITSRFHSKRAALTFEKTLGPSVSITSLPSRHDDFDPTNWWKHRDPAKLVFLEYQKLVFMYLESFWTRNES